MTARRSPSSPRLSAVREGPVRDGLSDFLTYLTKERLNAQVHARSLAPAIARRLPLPRPPI